MESGCNNSDDPFLFHLQSMNDDIKTVEKLHIRFQDTIPLIKTLHTAASIKQLQATMDSHIDQLFLVSKSIIQRLSISIHHDDDDDDQGTTHHQTPPPPPPPPPPPHQTPHQTLDVVVVCAELAKKIKNLMDGFQGLRLKIVGLYKQTIESIYYRVTKEKQSVEAIENLISTGEIDTFLRVAALEHQEASVGILDVVQEIQERINNAKYMQNYLIQLHHMFVDMLSLLEAHTKKLCPVPAAAPPKGKGVGLGDTSIKIDDDDVSRIMRMDPKKKATTAATIIMLVMFFILLVILIVILIVSLFQLGRERKRDRDRDRSRL